MNDALVVQLLSLVPRNTASRWMGRTARSTLSRWLCRAFVRAYGIDLSEAEGDLDDYGSLSELFVRRLKPGARPIAQGADNVVSPVDGTVASVTLGAIDTVRLGKGAPMSLEALVGQPVDGPHDVVVLYLSPTDYHRVHIPREGRATGWKYTPGTLWPVMPAAVNSVPQLFLRNERVTATFDTDVGTLHAVLLGAFGVGRMELAFTDLLTNTGAQSTRGVLDHPVERGADLGAFHLGSTVVLVCGAGRVEWTTRPGDTVRMGQTIGNRRPIQDSNADG